MTLEHRLQTQAQPGIPPTLVVAFSRIHGATFALCRNLNHFLQGGLAVSQETGDPLGWQDLQHASRQRISNT